MERTAILQDRQGFRAQGGGGGGGGSTIATGGVGLPFLSEVGGGPRNARWIMLAPRCGDPPRNRQDGPRREPRLVQHARLRRRFIRVAVADRSPLSCNDCDDAADHGKCDRGEHDNENHYSIDRGIALLLVDVDHFPLGGQRALPCSVGLLPPCAVRHSAFPLLQVPKHQHRGYHDAASLGSVPTVRAGQPKATRGDLIAGERDPDGSLACRRCQNGDGMEPCDLAASPGEEQPAQCLRRRVARDAAGTARRMPRQRGRQAEPRGWPTAGAARVALDQHRLAVGGWTEMDRHPVIC
jgi:hypothetical protein